MIKLVCDKCGKEGAINFRKETSFKIFNFELCLSCAPIISQKIEDFVKEREEITTEFIGNVLT